MYYFLWTLYNKICTPVIFVHHLISEFLWDMYWYKGVVPKKYGRPYTKTPLLERVRTAWYKARFGEE